MRIVIINQYAENRGDEAAGTALVRNLLKDFDVERIDIIYNSAFPLDINDDKVFHRNEDLRLKKIGRMGILRYLLLANTPFDKWSFANPVMKNMIQTIKEADYIYVTPCGASIGIYQDWAFLLRLLFVIKANKKPIFCLNTIGASGNKLFDFLADRVLSHSALYVREQRSFDYLSNKGLTSQLGVDTAFSLPPLYVQRQKNRIGLVVTLLDWHPEFKGRDMAQEVLDEIMPGIATFCQKNNYQLDLIPHTGKQDEYDYMLKVQKKFIEEGMDLKNLTLREDVKTSDEYDMALAEMKMVIGMRYHSIVLAAKNAVPYLALAYENKMREVCRYTDTLECCLDLQDYISIKDVNDKLEYVHDNGGLIEEKLKKRYAEYLYEMSRLPLSEIKE